MRTRECNGSTGKNNLGFVYYFLYAFFLMTSRDYDDDDDDDNNCDGAATEEEAAGFARLFLGRKKETMHWCNVRLLYKFSFGCKNLGGGN